MSKAKPKTPAFINPAIFVEYLPDERPAVRSVDLARHFSMNHKDVLRDIRNLQGKTPSDFNGRNFAPVEYADDKGEQRPCFLLTRDAFTLLVMGWNSARAIEWKLKYIEAFNSLERAALENARLEGKALAAQAVLSIAPERLGQLREVARYSRMGLNGIEIGKLMGVGKDHAWKLVKRAKALGLLEVL